MAAYIKFTDVEGECKDKDHKGWSDLVSFSQQMSKPGTGTGATRRRGDVVCEDISIVKELDKASPKLAESMCLGHVYPKVEIHVTASYTTAGRVTYYSYELTNSQVVNYSVGGSGQADEVPTEEILINFEEIMVTYVECDAKGEEVGRIEYSWKVEAGEV
jgi:type VI secretion system secreted protein Hcp